MEVADRLLRSEREEGELVADLSEPVRAAVGKAARMVETLIGELRAKGEVERP